MMDATERERAPRDPAGNALSDVGPPDDAFRWFVRLQSGEATERDRRQFAIWLREDEDHRRAYERIAAVWTELEHVEYRSWPEWEEALAAWQACIGARRKTIRCPGRWAVAAALVAIVTGWLFWIPPPESNTDSYRTGTGDQRLVTLADGSTLHLNAETRLSVAMASNARVVRLEQGEIFLAVAHDPERSFEVLAASGTVRALGTEFTVALDGRQVSVTVLDGVVQVAPPSAGSAIGSPLILERGQHLVYTSDGVLTGPEPADLQMTTAWRIGRLVFQRTRLVDALRQVARYRPEEVRLADPALADLMVSGVFLITNLDGFFRAIPQIHPVRVIRAGEDLIVIDRADHP